jgi:KDO2-lipid IV(A) lauroyltransferase
MDRVFSRSLRSAWHHVRYLPLLSALTVSRPRGFAKRSRALGAMVGVVTRWFPPARWRFDREVSLVFSDMPRGERARMSRDMGRHMGQTLFEIYHCAEFQTRQDTFRFSGPGLAALEKARAAGKGALIVSGHFGQWEAIRAVLKSRGMETGAVYRPQTNRHYQRRLLAGIEAGGKPILETGRLGTKALVRHLREGGFMAILLDEKYAEGVRIPFLGRPALTSLAAAQLALKYDLPMVPAYGTRSADGSSFDVAFEDAIPHTDPDTMTRAFNDSLSARILANPDQWYWLLGRWKGA